MMVGRCGVALTGFLLLYAVYSAHATDPGEWQERTNRGTVSVISGGINGTYIRVATDLASVLNGKNDLRVLPIMGMGSVQNIDDILYLKGIDIGIVQSDVFSFIKSQNKHPNIDERIRYITKLYNEEFHLIAGPDVVSIKDLEGRKVNFGVEGSGTFMTASLVFDTLGVQPEITSFDQGLAIEKIKQNEIAATVYVAGKPAQLLRELKPEDGLQLVEIPLTPDLLEIYLPARLEHGDYPQIVPADGHVKTIAVGAVMAVYNWEPGSIRFRKVRNFINAFFENFGDFQSPPRHAKWREVSLTAEVPGWTRFAPAEDWLRTSATSGSGDLKREFEEFLQAQAPGLAEQLASKSQKDELFRLFIRWQNQQIQ